MYLLKYIIYMFLKVSIIYRIYICNIKYFNIYNTIFIYIIIYIFLNII